MEQEKVKMYKRIIALLVDLLIVAVISVLISYTLPINEKYQTAQNSQTELLTMRTEGKITNDDYVKKSSELTYDAYKYGVAEYCISIGVMLAYFTLFTYFNNGKTAGKMLMKIEVRDKNDSSPSLWRSFVRTILISRVFADIITFIMVHTMKKASFVKANNYVDMILLVIWLLCPFIAMFREDGRGLHDLIAGTVVVNKRKRTEEEIPEAKIEEKKEVVKKEKKTTKKTTKNNKK